VADRAAALLTGAPARLASALLKLDEAIGQLSGSELQPLCAFRAFMLVDPKGERQFGLLWTHPSVAQEVRRLMELDSLLSGW
jgi:heat shock protein HtpX